MQGSDYFNLAQQAQKEGRWQDAVAHLEEGDRQGCGMSMWWLAECYDRGYWGKEDDTYRTVYMNLIQKSIEHGNERAMWLCDSLDIEPSDPYVIGLCYTFGKQKFAMDIEMARDYFLKCADSFAKRKLYWNIEYLPVLDNTLPVLRKLGHEGNPFDQFIIADELECYHTKRHEESLYWYRKAADQMHVDSIGTLYEHFMFIEPNYAKGRYWYNKFKLTKRYALYGGRRYIDNQDQVFDGIEKCQKACYQVILIRKYRQSILSWIPKDVVLMIAKILWETYEDVCWQERRSNRLRSKKKIKYSK